MLSHACASSQRLPSSATCNWACGAASLTRHIVVQNVKVCYIFHPVYPEAQCTCCFWYAVHLFQPALETGRYKSAVQKDKGRSVYSVWECKCKLRFALVQTNQVCWGFHLMLLFSKPTSGRKFSDLITAHGISMWHFDYFYLGNITNKYIRLGWPTSARLKSGF